MLITLVPQLTYYLPTDLIYSWLHEPFLGNSDHDGIGFTTLASDDVKTVTRMCYQYSQADVSDLCNTLKSIPWDSCFSPEPDANEVWNSFKDLLFAANKDVVPIARQKGKKTEPLYHP